MNSHDISSELDAVMIAIRKASNEWESRGWPFGSSAKSPDGDKEYIEYLVRVAYLTLLSFLDRNGFNRLSEYLISKWKNHENDLLASDVSDFVGEPFLRATSTLWEVVNSIRNLLPSKLLGESSPKIIDLEKILEAIPLAAHQLKWELKQEMDINRLAEALLLPLYPDLNSNPSLTLPESYRQPDSAIPSLKTLIEYKYIATKGDVSKTIDAMQADIRNYAQEPWKHLVFVVGQVKRFSTKTKLEATLLKEPSSFKRIKLALIEV